MTQRLLTISKELEGYSIISLVFPGKRSPRKL